jgi:hypothetical protein
MIKMSKIGDFRKKWLKKGYELINITGLLEAKLGCSGWCNDFNEPDDTIHHIQLLYRDEVVANVGHSKIDIIDEDKYLSFKDLDNDFIIFRKVKQ